MCKSRLFRSAKTKNTARKVTDVAQNVDNSSVKEEQEASENNNLEVFKKLKKDKK